MATEYVSLIILEVNGQQIDDFQKVDVDEVKGRELIQLMNKWGFVKVPKVYKLTLHYIVPSDAPEFDFEGQLANGTITLDKQNGVRESYGSVYWLATSQHTYEGGKETIRPIQVAALRKANT